MAQINNDRFAKHVASSGSARYRHVSESFAKHLPYQHAFSTKLHPVDQSDAMMPQGLVHSNDAYFVANARAAAYQKKNGGSLVYPTNGQIIALCEWPTQARIRDIRAIPTTAAMDPDSTNLSYFPADTAAAFPSFTLQANDPNDPDFTPIPLLMNRVFTDSGTDTVNIPVLSLAAMSFGVNRRDDPLIIEAVLGGNVVANSGLFVFCEFAIAGP